MSLPYKFLPQVQAQRKPTEVQLDNGATCKLEIAHPVEKCFSGGVRNWDTSAFNFLWGAEHGEIMREIRCSGFIVRSVRLRLEVCRFRNLLQCGCLPCAQVRPFSAEFATTTQLEHNWTCPASKNKSNFP